MTPAVLPAVPTTSKIDNTLIGVPDEDQNLPDLVLKGNEPDIVDPGNDDQVPKTVAAGNTEEDLEAASTLLSLGDTRDDTLDEDDKNTQMMPIGGANVPVDVAPEPLRLDQVSVDNAIAGIVQTEKLEKDSATAKTTDQQTAEEDLMVEPLLDPVDQKENKPMVIKGALQTKTYALKK